MHDPLGGHERHVARLPELDWDEISEPGCYLLIASGLLARVYPGAIPPSSRNPVKGGRTRVVRLSDNPSEPLQTLRAIALRCDYLVRF